MEDVLIVHVLSVPAVADCQMEFAIFVFFLGGFAINGMCLVVLFSVFQVPSP
jgi:hypothetical protein